MAARLRPEQVSAAHQSLHHLVAQAAWSDEALLAAVREQVLPALGPITAWIVDDTGFAKKGQHSVGEPRRDSRRQFRLASYAAKSASAKVT